MDLHDELSGLRGRGGDHTVTEIAQQPHLWRTIAEDAAGIRHLSTEFLQPLLRRPDLRVVFTGAGTSAFAGEVLAPVLARRLGRRVDAVATTDVVANPGECFAENVATLLVSFARSGDSPESLAATRLADHHLAEVHHLLITCNAEDALAQEHRSRPDSRLLLTPPAANDQGFAMTSSFTCMTMLALLAFGDYDGAGDPLAQRLADAADDVLATHSGNARALAATRPSRLVYLGSGALKGLAHESALKVLELTGGRVIGVSESSLGFRHGPKAILNDTTVAVVFASNDPYTRRYDLDIAYELGRALPTGHAILITADGDGSQDDASVVTWRLPGLTGLDDAAAALPAVLCAQLIALNLSLANGRTPDNPFPSGEVNRVVQGVTIHAPGSSDRPIGTALSPPPAQQTSAEPAAPATAPGSGNVPRR